MKNIEKTVEYIPYAGDSVIANVKPLALRHLSVKESRGNTCIHLQGT